MASPEAEDVRVIQTIGHVDHGKTTFVDSLLAANNIISTRMAGKIRYLDSREDEQQRGITMESSAVSLHFKVMERTADGGSSPKKYVVNLIDTPGHVDFSSEVSTASRLCDGALVLVDVVEGVCTQTIAVLRQAWLDRLRPILVINKFDRLITELKLAPVEAYHHLSQLIEQVNAVMGSFFASERMEDDLRWHEKRERRLAERKEQTAEAAGTDAASGDLTDRFEEKDDEDIYFAPDRGNVIFASAIDGWGFRVGKFAQLFATKLGIKESNLRQVLWGDFYLDPKTKRVISYKHLRGRNLKPLFVQFVLENIWAVYDSIVLNPNSDKVAKIVTTLNLKIPPRDLKSKDTRHLLSLVFSQWLSLSTCTIQAVVEVIPPPSSAQRSRIPKMLYPDIHEETIEPKNKLETNLWECDAGDDACVVAYVSKMFAVPTKELPEKKPKAITAEEMRRRGREAREAREAASQAGDSPGMPRQGEDTLPQSVSEEAVPAESVEETLLGFARLYSGTIRANTSIHCVLPKYNNSLPPTHPRNTRYVSTTQVKALYIMMGRELVPAESVQAGNVFAISGLEGKVWRNATICAPGGAQGATALTDDSAEYLLNLGGVNRQSPPIVRVALESVVPADMPKVVRGLRLLSQSDPCVETFQQQTGEHVILTAGELHLERCLKDLRERFAKVEIQASKPIVPFRETAIRAADLPPPKAGPNAPRGTINGSSSNGLVKFTVRAIPLPDAIIDFLQANISILKKLGREAEARTSGHDRPGLTGTGEAVGPEKAPGAAEAEIDDDDLDEMSSGAEGDLVRRPTVRPDEFWDALGKLFDQSGSEWNAVCERIWSFGPFRVGPNVLVDRRQGTTVNSLRDRTARSSDSRTLRDFEDSIETGFQIATFQGPLCAEPLVGMAFVVEDMSFPESDGQSVDTRTSQASGSLIPAIKEACRSATLDWSPRLMLAMYTCDIQASTDVLGKVYATVARRRGRIISEEMNESTSLFTIKAMLPVVESFGFAEDIRTRTSGAASPQLIFSGYDLYDQDPFWVPTTEEELEDLGEKADRENIARVYMNSVRARKGMFVEKKIVQFAEKQRTLKR